MGKSTGLGMTVPMKHLAKKGPSVLATKRKHRRGKGREKYHMYCARVFRERAPKMKMSLKGMEVMHDMTSYVFDRIMNECALLHSIPRRKVSNTLTQKDVLTSVLVSMAPELATRVTQYANSAIKMSSQSAASAALSKTIAKNQAT